MMKKYKFLYIDDENDETTEAIADGLEINDLLDVKYIVPKDFKAQKTFFEASLKDYDGVILDFRLDGRILDLPYNAPALAQELHMMAADRKIKSCPIILCSTEEKMKATYDVDKTSHDLFDYKFHKQADPPWEKFARKIHALAHGYEYILGQNFELKKILNREDLDSLDNRIFERFVGIEKPFLASEYAAFVIKGLFHIPGPLIKERLLAARLGINIEKSGNNWQKLLDSVLKPALYTGAFSDGWTRWWADKVLGSFKDLTGKRLSILNGEERVKLLIESTGLDGLTAASPLPYAKSTNFWTVCEYHKAPLDPLEGFIIHSSIEPKSWQENRYVSLDAVIARRGPKPHSSELERIELLKQEISKK